jgi:DNA-binding IclR family transcriptional regulator
MDISRTFDLPQSSTSELLKCMTSLGYLAYDAHRRSYRPTARVAMLGAWVQPSLFRRGRLLDMMDELSRATGEFVVAGMLVGLDVRYIHVVQSRKLSNTVVPDCSHLPLHTAMGRALLSTMPQDKVRKLVHRINAEATPRWRIAPPDFLAILGEVRERGYAMTLNTVWNDGGMLCIPLPDSGDGQRLAIGLGGEAEGMRKNAARFSALLHQTMEKYFAPRSSAPIQFPVRARLSA